MDYFPSTLYQKQVQFWPVIDDRLRKGNFCSWNVHQQIYTYKFTYENWIAMVMAIIISSSGLFQYKSQGRGSKAIQGWKFYLLIFACQFWEKNDKYWMI